MGVWIVVTEVAAEPPGRLLWWGRPSTERVVEHFLLLRGFRNGELVRVHRSFLFYWVQTDLFNVARNGKP